MSFKFEADDTSELLDDPAVADDRPQKRKRNKPTLSCGECVEKKTKCDRGRPQCLACLRRKTPCSYQLKTTNARRDSESIEQHDAQATRRLDALLPSTTTSRLTADHAVEHITESFARMAPSPPGEARPLSSIPFSAAKASNIYGIGSEHPFNNYWTLAGGLNEVISVLPSKAQADILMDKFFESIDPVYPLLYKPHFDRDYEAFWLLPFNERAQVGTSFVALLLVMLAMGTQFLRLPGDPATSQQNQSSSAEFYASACHQALRLGAYLNRANVQVLQTMIYMTYFLVNASHASDAWSFSGIIIRQAYAIGINRDHSLMFDPNLTEIEKVERRRVWIGIVGQDAFLAALLRLPPGAIYSDIDDARPDSEGIGETPPSTESSASSPSARRSSAGPDYGETSFDNSNDIVYARAIFKLALLVQKNLSAPRSLSLPMASSQEQRSQLVDRFESLRSSWPDIFRHTNDLTMYELCNRDAAGRRIARQVSILQSNYWWCVTTIQLEGCDQLEHRVMRYQIQSRNQDNAASKTATALMSAVEATLQAGHQGVSAFFLMHALLGDDAGTWWVMAQRAFTIALTMANLLKKHTSIFVPLSSRRTSNASAYTIPKTTATSSPPPGLHGSPSSSTNFSPVPLLDRDAVQRRPSDANPVFRQASLDVLKMITILRTLSAQDEISRTRVEVLEATVGIGSGEGLTSTG